MRIPGLGCLKGCLFTIAVFILAGWLVWEFTPVQSWVAEGKSFWQATTDGIGQVVDWISELGQASEQLPDTSDIKAPELDPGAGQ